MTARQGQFFIITAVLIAGALLTITTILSASQGADYNDVLERHGTDMVENLARNVDAEWWNRDWSYRRTLVVEERAAAALTNESVPVVLEARRSRVNDTCADIRVRADGEPVPWTAYTACNIDTYGSTSGALARYPLDGSGPYANDTTGHDLHGVLQGDPQRVTGHRDRGLLFDGNDDHVTVDGFPDLDQDITVAAWIRTSDSGSGNVIAADDENDGGWYVSVGDAGPGLVRFRVRGVGTLDGSTRVDDGAWHHVVAVRDDTNGRHAIYVDGELDASTSVSGTPSDDAGPVSIGGETDASGDTGRRFEGTLDDVRIYDRDWEADRVRGEALGGIGLNLSLDLSPLERQRVRIYYGNAVVGGPGWTGADREVTALAERPAVVESGPARSRAEMMEKMGGYIRELDAEVGPTLGFARGEECDLVTLQSPRTVLEYELCE